MGKAVVSTSLMCQRLDAKDGWNVAIADDPEEFAAKAAQLLRDGTLRAKIGKHERSTAKTRYDSKLVAAEHERLYDELLKR